MEDKNTIKDCNIPSVWEMRLERVPVVAELRRQLKDKIIGDLRREGYHQFHVSHPRFVFDDLLEEFKNSGYQVRNIDGWIVVSVDEFLTSSEIVAKFEQSDKK